MEIDTETVDSLLKISNNILIQGTGGIGKSMLMRYLFLNTANCGEYVPVLLQLRRVSSQKIDNISIMNLIYNSMKDFDIELPKEQFEYSLRLGKYLFLMDGFDEIKEDYAKKTAEAIQEFCSKYPKNAYIITSRPRRDTSPLETFTEVKSKTLSLDQAIFLSSKIWKEDEKTKEFCNQLRDGLYEKHKDFAENPLLLSMMFLTFMKNNSVPDHLAEFYSKAYEAIYCAHDSHDKGYFLREFKCKDIDENTFKMILCHFCFQTYFKEVYEFSKKSVLDFLNRSIRKIGVEHVNGKDYLNDLCDVVCILVEEGDVYRFSHRSFQTYFAAYYTSNSLTDEQQKKLFMKELSSESYWNKNDYYELLEQIEPKRFEENALEEGLRVIEEELNRSNNWEVDFLKLRFSEFSIQNDNIPIRFLIGNKDREYIYFNVVDLFFVFVSHERKRNYIKNDVKLLKRIVDKFNKNSHFITFEEIDEANYITEEEREKIWGILARAENTKKKRSAILKWLKAQDKKRELLDTSDFIDEL